MIRHIVFFTAKDKADIDAIITGLQTLKAIPGSRTFEISLNQKIDGFSNEIDVVLYSEFDNEAALAAFRAHPQYAEATARVRPLRELRFAADIKTTG